MSAVCKVCELLEAGEKVPRGFKHTPTEPMPSTQQIEAWILDSVCDATDGCQVEPDGRCPHGHESWLLELGLV